MCKTAKEDTTEKLSKLEKIKIILTILELIFAGTVIIKLFSVESSFNKTIELWAADINNKMMVFEEKVTTDIDTVKNVAFSSSVQNTTNIFDSAIDEDTDEETLLRYAESAYLSGDYETVTQIYNMSKLSDNAIACNNMGYMFAKGIYYPMDMEKAVYYYDKAIELDNVNAYYNKLALCFRHVQGDLLELLKQGYLWGNERMIEFVASHFEGYETYSDDEKTQMVYQLLYFTPEENQMEILSEFYVWEEQGFVSTTYRPEDTELVKYIYVSSDPVIEDDIAYTITTYEKYEMKCTGIDILQESWEWIK